MTNAYLYPTRLTNKEMTDCSCREHEYDIVPDFTGDFPKESVLNCQQTTLKASVKTVLVELVGGTTTWASQVLLAERRNDGALECRALSSPSYRPHLNRCAENDREP